MFGPILSWWVGKVIRQMQFPHQADDGRSISGNVLETFGSGCTLGLKGCSHEIFQKEARSIPWHLRAFFHEGRAMGVAGRSACSLRKPNPELTFQTARYQVMRFVGYGFWNGVAMTYPAPAPRLSENSSYWQGVSPYAKYRLLMANGFGFSTVLFAGKFGQNIKRRFLALNDARQREAVFHGVGRVLWFLYLNNFPALRKVLKENAEIVEPLGIGLGLAIAFTQAATPHKILRALDEFPEAQRRHLIRGAGIALEVHAGNDPECRVHIERLIHGELRDWYEGACQASQEAGDGTDWYPRYHEFTKRFAQLVGIE